MAIIDDLLGIVQGNETTMIKTKKGTILSLLEMKGKKLDGCELIIVDKELQRKELLKKLFGKAGKGVSSVDQKKLNDLVFEVANTMSFNGKKAFLNRLNNSINMELKLKDELSADRAKRLTKEEMKEILENPSHEMKQIIEELKKDI